MAGGRPDHHGTARAVGDPQMAHGFLALRPLAAGGGAVAPAVLGGESAEHLQRGAAGCENPRRAPPCRPRATPALPRALPAPTEAGVPSVAPGSRIDLTRVGVASRERRVRAAPGYPRCVGPGRTAARVDPRDRLASGGSVDVARGGGGVRSLCPLDHVALFAAGPPRRAHRRPAPDRAPRSMPPATACPSDRHFARDALRQESRTFWGVASAAAAATRLDASLLPR